MDDPEADESESMTDSRTGSEMGSDEESETGSESSESRVSDQDVVEDDDVHRDQILRMKLHLISDFPLELVPADQLLLLGGSGQPATAGNGQSLLPVTVKKSQFFVRIHLLDSTKNVYLRQRDSGRERDSDSDDDVKYLNPLVSQAGKVDFDSPSPRIVFEEELYLDVNYKDVTRKGALIMFELLRLPVTLAEEALGEWVQLGWGFVKPRSTTVKGALNVGKRVVAQVYRYPRNTPNVRKTKVSSPPPVYYIYSQTAALDKLHLSSKCAFSFSTQAVDRPEDKVLTGQRALQPTEKEQGRVTAGELVRRGRKTAKKQEIIRDKEEAATEGKMSDFDVEEAAGKQMELRRGLRSMQSGWCRVPEKRMFRLDPGVGGCYSLSFSRNGLYLAAAVALADGMHYCRIHSAFTGRVKAELGPHYAPIYQIDWSSDSSLIGTASGDGSVMVFDAASGMAAFERPGAPARYRHRTALVSTCHQPLHVYCARFVPVGGGKKGSAVSTTAVVPGGAAADGEGKLQLLVSGGYDKVIRIWNARSGELLYTTPEGEQDSHQARVNDIVFDADGKRMFSGDAAGSVRIWTCENLGSEETAKSGGLVCAKVVEETDTKGVGIASLDVFSGGNKVLVRTQDHCLRVLDVRFEAFTQKVTGVACSGYLMRSCVSPDGRLVLAGTEEGELMLWNVGGQGGAEAVLKQEADIQERVSVCAWHPLENVVALATYAPGVPIVLFGKVSFESVGPLSGGDLLSMVPGSAPGGTTGTAGAGAVTVTQTAPGASIGGLAARLALRKNRASGMGSGRPNAGKLLADLAARRKRLSDQRASSQARLATIGHATQEGETEGEDSGGGILL